MKKCKKLLAALLTFCMITASFAGMVFAAPDTGWQKIDGKWYYVQEDGTNAVGWKKSGGKWYYLDGENSGAMFSNCPGYIDGKIYVFGTNGVMKSDGWASIKQTVEGHEYTFWYYLNKSGTAITEKWMKDKGKWYYFSVGGRMISDGGLTIDGKTYLFGSDGAWISDAGWHKITTYYGTTWYYLGEDGCCVTGWKKIGGLWYYFDVFGGYMAANGSFDTNQTYNEGEEHVPNLYLFYKDGSMVTDEGWFKVKSTYGENTFTTWYYAKGGGKAKTGWLWNGGKWYYLNPDYGNMIADRTCLVKDVIYMFEGTGALTTKKGWYKILREWSDGTAHPEWYYLESEGVCKTGWYKSGKKWYYLSPYDGMMTTGTSLLIDDKVYMFDDDGRLTSETGWFRKTHKYTDGTEVVDWYYLKSGGVCTTEWKEIKDKQYYFDPYTGAMFAGGTYDIGGIEYTFNENGELVE